MKLYGVVCSYYEDPYLQFLPILSQILLKIKIFLFLFYDPRITKKQSIQKIYKKCNEFSNVNVILIESSLKNTPTRDFKDNIKIMCLKSIIYDHTRISKERNPDKNQKIIFLSLKKLPLSPVFDYINKIQELTKVNTLSRIKIKERSKYLPWYIFEKNEWCDFLIIDFLFLKSISTQSVRSTDFHFQDFFLIDKNKVIIKKVTFEDYIEHLFSYTKIINSSSSSSSNKKKEQFVYFNKTTYSFLYFHYDKERYDYYITSEGNPKNPKDLRYIKTNRYCGVFETPFEYLFFIKELTDISIDNIISKFDVPELTFQKDREKMIKTGYIENKIADYVFERSCEDDLFKIIFDTNSSSLKKISIRLENLEYFLECFISKVEYNNSSPKIILLITRGRYNSSFFNNEDGCKEEYYDMAIQYFSYLYSKHKSNNLIKKWYSEIPFDTESITMKKTVISSGQVIKTPSPPPPPPLTISNSNSNSNSNKDPKEQQPKEKTPIGLLKSFFKRKNSKKQKEQKEQQSNTSKTLIKPTIIPNGLCNFDIEYICVEKTNKLKSRRSLVNNSNHGNESIIKRISQNVSSLEDRLNGEKRPCIFYSNDNLFSIEHEYIIETMERKSFFVDYSLYSFSQKITLGKKSLENFNYGHYLREMSQYAFVLIPMTHLIPIDNDCLNIFEVISMGCIPIVLSSCYNDFFKENKIPVLIIKDYKDIESNLLLDTIEFYKGKKHLFQDHPFLYLNYWVKKIN